MVYNNYLLLLMIATICLTYIISQNINPEETRGVGVDCDFSSHCYHTDKQDYNP